MLKCAGCLFGPLNGKPKCAPHFSARNFSILERYIRAKPLSHELKIKEAKNEGINGEGARNGEARKANEKGASTYYPPNITRGVIPKSAYMNTWKLPDQPANPKYLKIALIGAPNAGKSSLLNSILNKTISAVSPKINTTRQDIKGIYTKDNVQLIFIDSPGIVPSHKKKKFCKELVSYAWKGYEEADLILFVADTVKRPTHDVFNIVRMLAPKNVEAYNSESEDEGETQQYSFNHPSEDNDQEEHFEWKGEPQNDLSNGSTSEKLYENSQKNVQKFVDYFSTAMEKEAKYRDKSVKENLLKNRKKIIQSYNSGVDSKNTTKSEGEQQKLVPPVILVLNKVDLCTNNKWANARAKEFMSNGNFDNIFFISAKYNKGIEELLDYITKFKAKNQFWVYPKDSNTTLTKVQVVEQLINTYLYCWFNKDVPYKVKHNMLSWCVNLDNSLIIEYQIVVKSQKVAKMICGVHNKLIINMRRNVSYKLTQLWGQNVYVHIHVKSVST
ncbi:GTPase Era, putative [Plasmodium knowlesi strain H]|uniref:GTPase Era, putative n=3 Tax=Plasmodium knowlesi TaxID=5850 RepID=A0A5K1VDA0_PLAKH|nr:GTPase Era, putative [Plasmodium knowlesi strain H]OTN66618.1 putative GTPase Era [Plasmodium knowlesi]CAA9986862.1 GTPase Era, putative [Plasmodium knowlesi strain H]SBO23709.1 GTPase Era, putative [Plasmodium knowlesi strain H]SBO25352.1 GTPase Era, putative [Plasmodium knowlesi strain H]VVS76336.1 GTPase Era, putative [Plasmodium knowlesi strain H]|eukprot:XP_002260654.1 GTPase, putative [Plasmodium knowlesi strain H]